MHDGEKKAPKERSSLFIFVPVLVLAGWLMYLAVAYAYQYGVDKGMATAHFRPPDRPDGTQEVFDMRRLAQPTDELIEVGARVYNVNCAACHGPEGKGDGPSGRNLAVRPRAFDSPHGDWRVGASVLEMYETLESGVGGMPNFPALNPRQKFAVIHYVHHELMGGDFPEDPPEALAALPGPTADTGPVNIDPYAEERIPVDYAIRKMLREARERESRPN